MDLSLKNKAWKEFELERLFTIYTGGDLIISRIIKGNIPIISHSIANNGIAEWTKPIKGQKLFNHKTTISLADRGNFYAFTQKIDFYIGTRVKALESDFLPCNSDILNFICILINKQSVKFSYGNNATGGTERIKILLPTTEQGNPDYEFMESYMRQKEQEKINAYKNFITKRISELKDIKDVVPLSEKDWGEFVIGGLFNLKIGKNVDGNKVNKSNGKIAYITRKEVNNGLDGFINFDNKYLTNIFPVITIGNETAEPFVQNYPFFTGTKVNILSPKTKLSKYSLFFIAQSLKMHKSKYSYSFTINSTRLKRQKIMLPLGESKQPDYEYMENYMKILELNKLKKYIEYQE